MNRPTLLRAAWSLACIFNSGCALAHGNPNISGEVEELGRRFVGTAPARALSLGIVKNGVVSTFDLGEYDRARHQAPKPATPYAIGSLSKTFAATLLAMAVVEKRVTLEDDVRHYLTGDYPNLEYDGHPIRLVHLLNHNSALPAMFPPALIAPPNPDPRAERARILAEGEVLRGYTNQAFLRDLRAWQLTAVPGTRFQYSNAAAELLRLVLEKVYGKSFDTLVRERISAPLQMRDTGVITLGSRSARLRGYDGAGEVVTNNVRFMPAAGGIQSTLRDLLKYVGWHLAERDPAVRLSHQSTWVIDGDYSLGLNWQVLTQPNYRKIWQEGGVPGFASYCVLYPELDIGIVALTNELTPQTASQLSELVKELSHRVDARAGK